MSINKYPYWNRSQIPSPNFSANKQKLTPHTPNAIKLQTSVVPDRLGSLWGLPTPESTLFMVEGARFVCWLPVSFESVQQPCWVDSAGLLEGTVFNLKCLSATQCPSDGVCHQPDNYMYLSWVSSCGCVFLRCVQQANACRGDSLRKERVTLNCRGTSMFYNHVSDDHVDLSALLNKDVPRLHIFAHRPPLWAPPAKIMDMHSRSHLNWNSSYGVLCKLLKRESCQIKLIQSVWCCVKVLLDIIQILNNLYNYAPPWWVSQIKNGKWQMSCRTDTLKYETQDQLMWPPPSLVQLRKLFFSRHSDCLYVFVHECISCPRLMF